MKKSLVLILALVLVLSFSMSAFALSFSDLGEQNQVTKDAVYKLSALGIVEGYEDGTWKPTAQITRAEFAKIAAIAGGFNASYESLGSVASPFSDVKVNVWYTGWVNLAYSQGFMKGDPTGLFRPNDSITEYEVVTVATRLLGYNDNLVGAWPVDYVRQAGLLGMLDDVRIVGNIPSTRATAAIVIAATLGEDTVTWSKDVEDFIFKTDANDNPISLLKANFKGNTVEDVNIDGFQYTDFEKNIVKIDLSGQANVGYDSLAADFQISKGLGFWQVGGHKGDAIFTEKAGKTYLAYLDVTSQNVTGVKPEITAINTGATAITKLKVNGTNYNVASGVTLTEADIAAAALATGEKGSIAVSIYIDEDGEIYAASNSDTASNWGVIKTIDGTYIDYEGNAQSGNPATNFNKKNVLVIKGGKASQGLGELKVGDLVYTNTTPANGDLDYRIRVYSTEKSGSLSKYSLNNTGNYKFDATVDGASVYMDNNVYAYDGADYSTVSRQDLQDQMGKSISYIVGPNGRAVALRFGEGDSNTVYGVVLDYNYSDATKRVSSIRVATKDSNGAGVTYTVDGAYIYNDDTIVATDVTNLANTKYYSNNTLGFLVKFRLNDKGEIDKALDPLVALNTTASNAFFSGQIDVEDKYEELKLKVVEAGAVATQPFNLKSNVVAFDVQYKTSGAIDKVVLIKYDDLVKGDISNGGYSYVVSDDGYVSTMVFTEFGASGTGNFGVIEDIRIYDDVVEDGVLFLGGAKYDTNGLLDDAEIDDLYMFDYSGSGLTSVLQLVYAATNPNDDPIDPPADLSPTVPGLQWIGTWDLGQPADLTKVGNALDKNTADGGYAENLLFGKATALVTTSIRVGGVSLSYNDDDTVIFDYNDLKEPVKINAATLRGRSIDNKYFAVWYTDDSDTADLIVVFNKVQN